jgi:hypothetical protein
MRLALEELHPELGEVFYKPFRCAVYAGEDGIAIMEQAGRYAEFKRRLRRLCKEEEDSVMPRPFWNVRAVELRSGTGTGSRAT